MSAFTTQHPCPVLTCEFSIFTDHFSKEANNYQDRMVYHIRVKHPLYFRWLRIQGRYIRLVKKWRAR